MKALFEDTVWKDIRKVSELEFPLEACSVLAGRKENGLFKIEKMIETKNRQSSRSSFKIDPKFIVDTLDELEGSDMELIGFFHTHPNMSAYVSERDEKFMKLWPGLEPPLENLDFLIPKVPNETLGHLAPASILDARK
ncbi:hypothetical protein AKJ37_02995 [candidate division MSBL1 archaeon SCGC-AAA259I09]|uniref:JAB domain-containing protein n=1 Tax=candidate division MSBL1 archaeon SCGC-AAA259I09 TaxID=1698267 RepID=A0A133UTB0_9EURY|nr:hypothetical protein AKJ37_02995 [candidate division MSBL1 archaeon SCGC-AAA259I09]